MTAHPPAPAAAAATAPRGTGRRHRGAIALKIGTAILSGEHRPGDTLPTELASMRELDVSRAAYREAMRTLAAKGLVAARTKVGTVVLPRERWHLLDPDVLAWTFSGTPDVAVVRSLFELRELVEPGAARLAAERRSADDVRDLRAALAGMRRFTLATAEGRRADQQFHEVLLRATRNHALVALTASIGAVVSWTTQFKQRLRELPRDPIPDHALVVDAIAAGDPAAAEEAMRRLVQLAFADTRQGMADSDTAG